MKTRNLFLSLFAFAALCACNKETDPVGPEVLEKDAYIAVSIVAPTDVASRAGTTGTDGNYYDPGTDAEKSVSSALFLFYKEDGTFDQLAKPTLKYNAQDTDNPYKEVVTEATIVLKAQTLAPKSLLVVLNPPTGLETEASTLSLTEMKEKFADYAASAPTSFIMTNSNYDKANGKCEVSCEGKIYADAASAIGDPVTVNVERVVSKVIVTDAAWKFKDGENVVTTVNVNFNSDVDANGNGSLDDKVIKQVKPSILGYKVTNIAEDSYLFKNVTGMTEDWMFDDANMRSYWATSHASNHEDDFVRYSFDEIEAETNKVFYCNENTDATTHSQLIVAVKFVDESDVEIGTFYKYQGEYYTEEGVKAIAVKLLKDNGYDYSALALTIAASTDKPWKAIVKFADETGKSAEELAVLTGMTDIWAWTNGHAYYFTTVDHFEGKVGMVRNHSYQINVQSIKGFGTPVYDDTKVIDPETPSDAEYLNLAATINILQWKIVKQDVDFGA